MVRLSDFSDAERTHIMAKELPSFDAHPWAGPPLSERRVVTVITAGLHRLDDDAFALVDVSYRVIPAETARSCPEDHWDHLAPTTLQETTDDDHDHP